MVRRSDAFSRWNSPNDWQQYTTISAMLFSNRLAARCLRPEMMDEPNLDSSRHNAALRALARINWFSGSAGILWGPLHKLAREHGGQPLRILDIATGGGDIPIRLWRRFQRAGLQAELAGAELSPIALAHARQRAQKSGA